MKKLTDKELAIMNVLWDNGALSMRDLLERMPEPRPNFNTLTTFVRRLEVSGMIKHQELADEQGECVPILQRLVQGFHILPCTAAGGKH